MVGVEQRPQVGLRGREAVVDRVDGWARVSCGGPVGAREECVGDGLVAGQGLGGAGGEEGCEGESEHSFFSFFLSSGLDWEVDVPSKIAD